MRASRVLGLLAGTTAIALATLVVASPASAATLPSGQKITVSQLDQPEVGPPAVQLYGASPTDASLSPTPQIGGGATTNSIDVDDDGHGYGVGTVQEGQQIGTTPFLYTVDANTGAITNAVEIVPVDPEVFITSCTAIDYVGGEIIIGCIDGSDGVLNTVLGTVTTDGAFTAFYDSDANEDGAMTVGALATDPVTGTLWLFAFPDGPAAFEVDRAVGELGEPVWLDQPVFGADFDRSGQVWVTTEVNSEPPADNELATVDLTTGTVSLVGPFSLDGVQQFFVSGITVWGKLAATGATTAELVPLGLGTALLLLAGAAFIATARIRRSA